jgi:hypothetical protein
VLHTHFKELPHQGVEAILAWIKQTFFPIGDARRLVAAVKKSCSKCHILLKQVVGLELADTHPSRAEIALPFAWPTNDCWKSFTVHELLVVCLLTLAMSIMVIDR